MKAATIHRWLLVFLALAMPVPCLPAQLPSTLLESLFDPGTNNQSGTRFGSRIAMDGDLVVVGAPATSLGQYRSGAVSVFSLPTGTLIHSLTNPGPVGSQNFGSAVAISANRVVVGAYGDLTGGTNAGVCYVYDLSSGTPTVPLMVITNPIPAGDGYFGISVAISGSRILVGAVGESSTVLRAGAAYLYDLNHVTPPVPIAKARNPTPIVDGAFGSSVAFAGTKGIIGPARTPGPQSSGTFYSYDMALPVLPGPNETLTDLVPTPLGIGSALATSGMSVVLGTSTGAQVYEISANAAWPTPLAVLTNPAAFSRASLSGFATTVGISGNRVIVGDPTFAHLTNGWDGTFDVGQTYVYDLTEITATHTSPPPTLVLTNLHSAYGDRFGNSFGFVNSRAVIGMPGADLAYVYNLDSVSPTAPTRTLSTFNPAKENFFGTSVAISSNRVVVSAPGDDTGAVDAGTAYLYEIGSRSLASPSITLANPTSGAGDNYGKAVAISGTRVLVGAPNSNVGANDAGTVHVYQLDSLQPTIPAITLTNPIPQPGAGFGSSLAMSGSRVVVGVPTYDHTELVSGRSYEYVDAGLAYVYDLNGTTPRMPRGKLISPWGGRFGQAVAISSSHVIVGGIYELGWAGRVYVYDYASQLSTNPAFVLSNPVPGSSWFGRSLAISSTRVVVGAGGTGSNPDIGRAYLYDLSTSNGSLPSITFVNPESSPYDRFGSSVAISGSIVLVATSRSLNPRDGGQVYIYDLAGAMPSMPVATLNHPNPFVGDSFGASAVVGSLIAMDADYVIVGAPLRDTIAADRGAAYVFGLSPVLNIVSGAPGFTTLSWAPATSSGFLLQHASSAAPTNWLTAPSGPTNPISIPTTNRAQFYRLIRQE